MKKNEIKSATATAIAVLHCEAGVVQIAAIAALSLQPVYLEYGSELIAECVTEEWIEKTIDALKDFRLPVAVEVKVVRPAKHNWLAKPDSPFDLKAEYFNNTCETTTRLIEMNDESIELFNQGDTEGAVNAAFQEVEGA